MTAAGKMKQTSNKKQKSKEEIPLIKQQLFNPDKKNYFQTCEYVLQNVTVEPTMGMFVLATILMLRTTQNLSLEKACRVNLNFTDEICDSLRKQKLESGNMYEKETQMLLAKFLSARTYISATFPIIVSLFAGPWSDKTGHRKVFLIIPIFGQMLCCISNIINAYFFKELGLEVLIFSEAVIEGLSGGWYLPFFTMFAFISAITSEETRTFRLGLLNFSLTVGLPIGMAISGFMLKSFGYYGCYLLSASLHSVNIVYSGFILREPERTAEQRKHDGKGVRSFLKSFFNLSNVKETIRVVFKRGPNQRRLRMCVMMLVVGVLFGPMNGEMSVMYLYTRYKFKWDEVKFSLFQSYNLVIHTIGTMFSITVFSKRLQWHDSVLGIISTSSKIAGSFVYCFASNGNMFYLAPLVEILNGTSMLAMRSILSKLVAPNELGKLNAIIGLNENLMPLIYVPLYTNVYKVTMDVLPGAVFLMGSAMTIPAVVVFIWLFYENRKGRRATHGDLDNLVKMS